MQRGKNMRRAIRTILQASGQFTEIATDSPSGLEGKDGVIKKYAHDMTSLELSIVFHARKGMLIGGNGFPGTTAPGKTRSLFYPPLYKQFSKA